jgi:hypothetical protein
MAASAAPNPFRESVRFQFADPDDAAGAPVVSIHDVRGRTLRRLDAAGGDLVWDGRDAKGAPVPAGVYFYRIVQGAAEATGRMVRLR